MKAFRSLSAVLLALSVGVAGAEASFAKTGRMVGAGSSLAAGWSAPVAVSKSSSSLRDTGLAVEATGEVSVAWTVARGSDSGVWVRRRSGDGTWVTAQLIDPVRDADVTLRADPVSGVCALYSFAVEGRFGVRVACAGSDGVFSSPVELVTPGSLGGPPRLVVDDAGTWTAGWIQTAEDGRRQVIVARRPADGAWTAPTPISPPRTIVRAFDLDTSPEGVVTVAWTGRLASQSSAEALIKVRQLRHGDWSSPDTISGPGGSDLDVDSANGGRVDVIWIHRGAGVQQIQTRGRTSSGWGDIKPLSPRTAPGFQFGYPPYVVVGSHGVAVFAWILFSPGQLDWDAQAFAVVRQHGGWGPATLLGPANGASERLRMGVDHAGNVIVTWLYSSMPAFADDYVVKTRRKPLAGPWQPTHPITTTVTADVSVSPSLVVDTKNQATLVWAGLKANQASQLSTRVFMASD